MAEKLIAYRPIKTDWYTQGFGDNGACCKVKADGSPVTPFVIGGVKEIKIVNGKKLAVCYPGYTLFYPTLGLGGHNGIDLGAVTGEKGYHSMNFSGTAYVEEDFSKGLGIRVISDQKMSTPVGDYYIVVVYWHIKKALITNGQKVKMGDLLFEANCTGACGGDHVHYAYKCFDTPEYPKNSDIYNNGAPEQQGNGFRGWQDIGLVYKNIFVLGIIRDLHLYQSSLNLTAEALKQLPNYPVPAQDSLLIALQRLLLLVRGRLQLLVGGDTINLTHNKMANVQTYSSSTGSGDIGLRYRGMMLGIVPALVIALSFFGNLFGIDTLKSITDTTVTQLVEAIFAVVASVLTLWGIVRPYLPRRK
jgi:hypothetical protein